MTNEEITALFQGKALVETLNDNDPNKNDLMQKIEELQKRYVDEKFNSEELRESTELNEAIAVICEAVNKSIEDLFNKVKDADETAKNDALKIAHMRKTAITFLMKNIFNGN